MFIKKNENLVFLSKAITLLLIVSLMIALSSAISMFLLGRGSTLSSLSQDSFQTLMESNKNLAKLIIGSNHVCVFLGSTTLYLLVFYKNRWKRFLNLNHFPPQYLLLFPLALFLLFPSMGYLSHWVEGLNLPEFIKSLDNDSLETLRSLLVMNSIGDLFINILIVGILAGIGEELIFRGIIQKEIANRYHRPHLAIWITAILFSAFHFQIVGFLPKLLIGALLGYAYYLSNNLILPIVIHFLNNSFATISLYFMSGIKIEEESIEKNVPLLSVAFSLLVFGWVFSLIYRNKVISKSAGHE